MGKPTAADLRLGLATAPVLFAASKFPELNAMIMRRFCEDGDVEKARDFVAQVRFASFLHCILCSKYLVNCNIRKYTLEHVPQQRLSKGNMIHMSKGNMIHKLDFLSFL